MERIWGGYGAGMERVAKEGRWWSVGCGVKGPTAGAICRTLDLASVPMIRAESLFENSALRPFGLSAYRSRRREEAEGGRYGPIARDEAGSRGNRLLTSAATVFRGRSAGEWESAHTPKRVAKRRQISKCFIYGKLQAVFRPWCRRTGRVGRRTPAARQLPIAPVGVSLGQSPVSKRPILLAVSKSPVRSGKVRSW
jgi:hypothetical protein